MARATRQANAIVISGPLTIPHLSQLELQFRALLRETQPGTVHIGLDGITALDTAGVIFLQRMPLVGAELDRQVHLEPVPARFQAFFQFVAKRRQPQDEAAAAAIGWWENLGERVLQWSGIVANFAFVASEVTWAAILAVPRRSGVRRGSLVEQCVALGSSAVPVVALILFLVGAVTALQAAEQLRQFGAEVFVAELVGIGITREIGPLMAAIIVAGRSGSSTAAEVATMRFTEELDALQTMSVDPLRFVVAPKLWAMLLCMPMLTVMANFCGILGGLVASTTVIGLSPQAFTSQLIEALFMRDIVSGLVKSVSFAWVIVVVSVYHGLSYSGGAPGVGRATTAAVVSSIFLIIAVNLFWGIVFYVQ